MNHPEEAQVRACSISATGVDTPYTDLRQTIAHQDRPSPLRIFQQNSKSENPKA